MGFIFSSSLTTVTNQEYMFNCPFPIQNQIAVLGSPPFIGGTGNANAIGATALNYTLNAPNQGVGNSTGSGTYFQCQIQNVIGGVPTPQVSIVVRDYSATAFANFPSGWFQFAGDTIGFAVTKVQIALLLMYNFTTAPAQVTGLVWFNYVNGFLLALVILGAFLVIRGG